MMMLSNLLLQDTTGLLDVNNGLGGVNIVAQIFWDAWTNKFGDGTGGLVLWVIPLGANWFSGLHSITSASRYHTSHVEQKIKHLDSQTLKCKLSQHIHFLMCIQVQPQTRGNRTCLPHMSVRMQSRGDKFWLHYLGSWMPFRVLS